MHFANWQRFGGMILLFTAMVLLGAVRQGTFAQKARLRSHIEPPCTPVGSQPLWKYSDLYGDGNIAVYGSTSCRGVFIFDITDPDNPILASWYNPSSTNWFTEAIVVGNRGYFGSGFDAGVHIVDLTDPYHPVFLGAVDPAHGNGFNRVHEMVVTGNYLIENLNGSPNRTLKFINISDPANPVFIRDLVLAETHTVHAVHVRGNRMITSRFGSFGGSGKSEIYDISNIETQEPTLLGVAVDDTGPGFSQDIWMHSSWTSEDGNYLYSCREWLDPDPNQNGDLRVYDIHDPAHPVLVNKLSSQTLGLNAGVPHNPVVKGNRLYVSWYQAGLQVFDISNPVQPVRIAEYDTYPDTFDVNARPAPRSLSQISGDVVCGRSMTTSAVSSGYDGSWAVYPFVGDDKVLVGDMNTGLYIVDASRAAEPLDNRVSDFDGDRRTDLSVFTPATGTWTTESTSTGAVGVTYFGVSQDILAPGDYDGDRVVDMAVYRPSTGVWYLQQSASGFSATPFGLSGDVPVAADYDADGKTDIAVWRPSDGIWYIQQSTLGFKAVGWGTNGDKPVTGDFEGDGKADVAVWRPSSGTWYVLRSSSTLAHYLGFGLSGDLPLSADFDGNGVTDFAVFRPSTGVWYVIDPKTSVFRAFYFGLATDIPIPADYDGDSKADVAVFRPGTREWFRLNSSDGSANVRVFGSAGDIPTSSSLQPR